MCDAQTEQVLSWILKMQSEEFVMKKLKQIQNNVKYIYIKKEKKHISETKSNNQRHKTD